MFKPLSQGLNGKGDEMAPTQTVFSQQRLEAWRPLFTPAISIIISMAIGLMFIGFGTAFYVTSKNLVEVIQRYDDICTGIKQCTVPITIPKRMKGNVFIHYRLTNFHQNHRNYYQSRSDEQLRGEYLDYAGLSSCGKYRSVGGSKEKKDWYTPCGAIPLSFFTDKYDFSAAAAFSDAGVSWRSDREKLFRPFNDQYNDTTRWLRNMGIEQEHRDDHFIVWMRISTLPTFLKSYSRCVGCDIAPGTYNMVIQNDYDTKKFGSGAKYVVISTVSTTGGKNPALGISYLSVGSIFVFFGIVVLITRIFFPRKLGDTAYFMGDI